MTFVGGGHSWPVVVVLVGVHRLLYFELVMVALIDVHRWWALVARCGGVGGRASPVVLRVGDGGAHQRS